MKKFLGGMILLSVLILGYIFFNGDKEEKKDEEDKDVQEVMILDSLEEYGYEIHDNDTELFKAYYEELKIILSADEIDDLAYVQKVAEMFITDLYNLDNKITKADIGGLEFIHPDYQDNFTLYISNELYKFLETDIYNDRDQELPVVSEVIIGEIEETTFTYNEVVYDAYNIPLVITYEKDLGYDQEATVTIIKDETHMYVVEMN